MTDITTEQSNHDCTDELLHDNFVSSYESKFGKTPDAAAEAIYAANINPEYIADAVYMAVKEVISIFEEAAYALECAAEEAAEVKAFVVTAVGDAPVKLSAIESAGFHEECSRAYALSGYAATPVTIRKNSLDGLVTLSLAQGAAYKAAAGAGK
jgi:hypothetical protein